MQPVLPLLQAELEQQRRILMAVGGMADDEPELKAALMQVRVW